MGFMPASEIYKTPKGTITVEDGEGLRPPEEIPNTHFGRPSVYSEDVKRETFRLITDKRQYWTIQGCAAFFNVTRETFYRWMHEKPDFNDTVKTALAIQEQNLAEKLFNGKCNPAGAIFVMKNSAHRWKDKHENEQTTSISQVIESVGLVNAVFDPSPLISSPGQALGLPEAGHGLLALDTTPPIASEFFEDESMDMAPEL